MPVLPVLPVLLDLTVVLVGLSKDPQRPAHVATEKLALLDPVLLQTQ